MPNADEAVQEKVATHWDGVVAPAKPLPLRWVDFPFIHRWLNKRICGEDLDAPGAYGLIRVMEKQLNGRVLRNGVSIGGGQGLREMEMIQKAYVEHMTVFDLSPARIELGRSLAQKEGLTGKIEFRCEDGMAASGAKYDFVFWHAALHHMFDTAAAVEWSWDVLNPGGFFWAMEYTGPNKAQYTDEMLDWATTIRRMFPPRLTAPNGKWRAVNIPVPKPRPFRNDPSEAVDSERILSAVKRVMPNAQIWPLGGIGYCIAFNGMAPRFDPKSKDDQYWIAAMMTIDDKLSEKGLNLRHAILAEKN